VVIQLTLAYLLCIPFWQQSPNQNDNLSLNLAWMCFL
jgi:hypothetical protein